MKLREAKLEDEKIIREMYEEYMSNDPIPGIDIDITNLLYFSQDNQCIMISHFAFNFHFPND